MLHNRLILVACALVLLCSSCGSADPVKVHLRVHNKKGQNVDLMDTPPRYVAQNFNLIYTICMEKFDNSYSGYNVAVYNIFGEMMYHWCSTTFPVYFAQITNLTDEEEFTKWQDYYSGNNDCYVHVKQKKDIESMFSVLHKTCKRQ